MTPQGATSANVDNVTGAHTDAHTGAQGADSSGPNAERAPDRPWLNLVVYPHRSLGRQGFRTLLIVIAVIMGIASLRFLAVGAWPVVLFVIADVAALWLAFRLNYRAARLFETVTLTDHDLVVARIHPDGRRESWIFEPTWLRVTQDRDGAGRSRAVALTSHGRTLHMGRFLAPWEREELGTALQDGLARWRAGQGGHRETE
ncbi:DUF2244 domain-containing protein [Yunchengibacter salinarum]|uniref:DUF2244 domain-containing protein n=1 Tax=Yunchengibacter salinarum TaxID=3133399 RepID=UPI0035B5B928